MYAAISLLRLKNTMTPLDQSMSKATTSTMSEAAAILMNMKLSLDEVQDSQATHASKAKQAATILLKMKNQRLSLDEVQDSQASKAMEAKQAITILLKIKNQRLSLDEAQDSQAKQATQASAAAILLKMKNQRF